MCSPAYSSIARAILSLHELFECRVTYCTDTSLLLVGRGKEFREWSYFAGPWQWWSTTDRKDLVAELLTPPFPG